MPDFTVKNNFPIAEVINAAQRKAQLEQESQQQGNKSLLEGLQSIGQVGQDLVDKRLQVAKALAIGRHFNYPDEVSRNMSPDEVLKSATIDKGMIDSDWLRTAFQHVGGGIPGGPATPASTPPAPATPPANGAMLTSNATATPTPVATPSVPTQAPPVPAKMVNPATFNAGMKILGNQVTVMTPEEGLEKRHVPKGTVFKEPPGASPADKKEQDAYWRDAVSGLRGIRGDSAMKDIETQRNSAITAYNRLQDIEYSGKAPNPIDYVDILGQIYKARTGQAPGEVVLKDAKQATSTGQLNKFWTYATGQQMPATTKDIASSLKDMVAHMGLQADQLHEGYMQVHGSEVFNPNMSEENKAKLSKLSRGKSFTDATSVKPEDYDPHVQAIKWAQANPNDPRSASILKKAMEAKSQGGSIGL